MTIHLSGVVLACCGSCVAQLIASLTGFGAGIIFQCLWMLLGVMKIPDCGDLKISVGTISFSGVVGSILISINACQNQSTIQWPVVCAIFPSFLLFHWVGVYALAKTDQIILKRSLGVTFICFAIYQLIHRLYNYYKTSRANKLLKLKQQNAAEKQKEVTVNDDLNESEPQVLLELMLQAPSSAEHVATSELQVTLSKETEAGSDPPLLSTTLNEQLSSTYIDINTTALNHSALCNLPLINPAVTKLMKCKLKEFPITKEMANIYDSEEQLSPELMLQNSNILHTDLTGLETTITREPEADLVSALSSTNPITVISINEPCPANVNSDPTVSGHQIPLSAVPFISSGSEVMKFDLHFIGDLQGSSGSKLKWYDTILSAFKQPYTLWGILVGCCGGVLSGAFGTGGPPVMIYFTYIGSSGTQIRNTYTIMTLLLYPNTFLSNFFFDIYKTAYWPFYVFCPLTGVIGYIIGNYYHTRIQTSTIVIILQLLILLSSIPLTNPGISNSYSIVMLVIYIIILLIGLSLLSVLLLKRWKAKQVEQSH
ncbi:unnamed protein product [Didymodactylos carnosus]|uniref:Uncharacterized protein n=1 Tax=Didymodactylos carnosus TaxID=1234261 RepID=A0A814GU93_9BILA|nr:unnamed protein product [Didymodactylos carnosus]CAF1001376.1 unnamed protein product [Didymodactylos carnosus]CAF3719568.1 unnamed protein product [Didymodactylos carnosus]CAF3773692.1 unnamed protein product [Didymodactylos carnosus]